jgi:hypothetical protein
MNRIESLDERVAELEHRLADVAQRQTKDSAECYRRREIQRSPINSGLRLVPPAHRETSNADSRDQWVEQMKLRLALLSKKSQLTAST